MAIYRWSSKEMSQRELRRPQYVDSDDRPARRRTKKNTRKWCKGIVGREHSFTWKMDPKFQGYPWAHRDSRHYVRSCDLCGKHHVKSYGFYIICIENEKDKRWIEQRMKGLWAWWG